MSNVMRMHERASIKSFVRRADGQAAHGGSGASSADRLPAVQLRVSLTLVCSRDGMHQRCCGSACFRSCIGFSLKVCAMRLRTRVPVCGLVWFIAAMFLTIIMVINFLVLRRVRSLTAQIVLYNVAPRTFTVKKYELLQKYCAAESIAL